LARETQLEQSRSVALLLYNVCRRDVAVGVRSAIERAIEVTAALAGYLLDGGYSVSLATVSGCLSSGNDRGQLGRILRALALLEIERSEEMRPLALSHPADVQVMIYPESESPPLPRRKGAIQLGVAAQTAEGT
jgi:uncharacterized protein (DUF58 family)